MAVFIPVLLITGIALIFLRRGRRRNYSTIEPGRSGRDYPPMDQGNFTEMDAILTSMEMTTVL